MICEYYSEDGNLQESGSFNLLTKSLYRAVVDAEVITGFKVTKFAHNFAVLGKRNKRLIVSVSNE